MISHVFTKPEFRRRGLAAKVLDLAVDTFLEGIGTVLLLGTDSAEALPLYTRRGFVPLNGSVETGMIMFHSITPGTKAVNDKDYLLSLYATSPESNFEVIPLSRDFLASTTLLVNLFDDGEKLANWDKGINAEEKIVMCIQNTETTETKTFIVINTSNRVVLGICCGTTNKKEIYVAGPDVNRVSEFFTSL